MAKRSDRSSSSQNDGFGANRPVIPPGLFDAAAIGADMAPGSEVPATGVAPSQIVFIEGNVPDAEELAQGVTPGARVVLLDPSLDGVRQIADYLTSHRIQNLAAISIVAHGADGLLDLGTTELNATTIGQYQSQLAAIGAALQPGGAIQLYGCDVAQDAAGDAFLQQLSQAAGGANVAASSGLVGAAADGGSWTLNIDVGTVDVGNPFTTAAQAAYPDVLPAAPSGVLYIGSFNDESTGTINQIDALTLSAGVTPTGTNDIANSSSAGDSVIGSIAAVAIDPARDKAFILGYDDINSGSPSNNPETEIFSMPAGGGSLTPFYQPPGNLQTDETGDVGGIAVNEATGTLYFTQQDFNENTGSQIAGDTGVFTLPESGGTPTQVIDSVDNGTTLENPTTLALDPTNNLVFFVDNESAFLAPGPTDGLFVGDINSSSADYEDFVELTTLAAGGENGLAINPATDTIYWSVENQGGATPGTVNAIYSATYTPQAGGLATIGTTKTLYTGSDANFPGGLALDPTNNILYIGGTEIESGDTAHNAGAVYEASASPATTNGSAVNQVFTVESTTAADSSWSFPVTFEAEPTVTASGTVSYTAGGSAVTLDSGLSVTDATEPDLVKAMVTIVSPGAGDTLTVGSADGLSTSFSAGTLTLTGTAALANFQVALDTVKFATTGGVSGNRTIDWTINDGVITSAAGTSTVSVTIPAPTVTAGGTVTFNGGGTAAMLDSGLAISDPASTTLTSATIVDSGSITGDTLTVGTLGGLGSVFSNGTLTLSGTASLSVYQTALDSVKFGFSANSDPTGGGSHTSRTIDWTVNAGTLVSNTGTSTLDTVHTAPTVTAGATATFTGGGGAVVLDSGLAVSDVDSGGVLSSATVTVAGAITGDTLNFTNINSTTEGNVAVASDSNGVLKLTSAGSTATLAQWQTALASVTYSFSPSFGDPTNGGGDTSRTIDWLVNDGVLNSGTVTSTLDVTHVAPALTTSGTATFDGGGSAVTLDSGASISDPDSGGTLHSATVSVASFVSGDILSATTTGTPSIIVNYNTTTGTLTLTGTDTLADYQAALRSVSFSFNPSNGDPTGGGSHTSSTIDWSINDGVASSGTTTSTLNVVHVAPTVTASGTVDYGPLGSPAVLDSTLTASDPDSGGNLTGATVDISSGFTTGDALNFATQNGITESGFSNGTLSLTGAASIANYQAALRSVTYSSSLSDPTVGGTDNSRTISWSVNDGVTISAVPTSTVDVFACFVTGTRIATRDGPRPVEALRIGDLVLTRSGEARPIRWIGHRSVDPRRHPRPEQVHPLRIAAGAFGPGRPERPVFVSPDHGICVDGVDAGASVLVPAGLLANGVNIARVDLGAVTYWHVELDTHDVIMAEGLPVESWLDDGRRDNFDNGEAPVRSHPDFAPPSNAWRWEAAGCLRMVLTGPLLEAARRQAEGPDWRGPGVRAGWTLPFAPPYRASGPPRQTAA